MHTIETDKFTIRRATEADYDFILRVNEENVEVLAPMDREKLVRFTEMARFVWIACAGGQRAAFLIALNEDAVSYESENYRWFRQQYEHFLYIDRIVIDKPFRKMGLGRTLYEAVFRYAKDNDIPIVTAEIDTIPYNETSLNFHREMGFREVGEQFVRGGSIKVSLQARTIASATDNMENFKLFINNEIATESPAVASAFAPELLTRIRAFHSGMSGYAPTPLVRLTEMEKKLGLDCFMIKDESKRFDLNAFKVLGGSYAIASYMCGMLGVPLDENSYEYLLNSEAAKKLDLTFATATDGNHGRGIAWAANKFGKKAYVFMPKGSSAERLENIRKLGATAEITDMNYDDTVRYVSELAKKNNWVLVQDTSWDGYEEIPRSVLMGYTTIASEISEQLDDAGADVPTHIFLQAGVGCFAGAMAGYFKARFKDKCPLITIVEPDKADCHFRTAAANDGSRHFVSGSMDSIMAGLCCGEPCTLSWEIIKNTARGYISCSDDFTRLGMRALANTENPSERVVSGESGAVTTGVVIALMSHPELAEYKNTLGLSDKSRVLVISTEGATDINSYNSIVGTKAISLTD